jgi:hypothetical protein
VVNRRDQDTTKREDTSRIDKIYMDMCFPKRVQLYTYIGVCKVLLLLISVVIETMNTKPCYKA